LSWVESAASMTLFRRVRVYVKCYFFPKYHGQRVGGDTSFTW